MSESTRAPDRRSDERRRWRAYWVCVFVAALTIAEISKVNVALPAIDEAFEANSTELQLIVAGYVLAFGLTLVPAGRLGDHGFRKTLFIAGLLLFITSSLVCALAPSGLVLIVMRLVQGVAAGMQMPQSIGLIQELFQGAERGKVFGLLGATIFIASALGPTLGGLLIALGGPEDGWRGVFWMNLPVGVAALAVAIWLLPRGQKHPRQPVSADVIGTAIFAMTVLTLMVPFLLTTGSPEDSPARWWFLVPFVLGVAGFVAWERHYERRGRDPLVPLRLFRISSFRNGILLATAYFASIPSMFLLTALFLQEAFGVEPVYAGLVTVSAAIAGAFASWGGGLSLNRFGRAVVVTGLAAVIVGSMLLVVVALVVSPAATPWVMAGVMVIVGFGGGLVVSPNQALTLADIPVRRGGLAGSVGQLGQRIGTTIGAAAALAFYYSTITRESSGGVDHVAAHQQGYMYGMLCAVIFLALAFVVGVVDLDARRRAKRLDWNRDESSQGGAG